MIGHEASKENKNRWDLIMSSTNRIDRDGLTNIHNLSKIIGVEEYNKYTRLIVQVSSSN